MGANEPLYNPGLFFANPAPYLNLQLMTRQCRMVGCRSTRCDWEGTCGQFFPADGTTTQDVAQLAGVLCQCGCPGARHVDWYETDEVKFGFHFAKFVAEIGQTHPKDSRTQTGPAKVRAGLFLTCIRLR